MADQGNLSLKYSDTQDNKGHYSYFVLHTRLPPGMITWLHLIAAYGLQQIFCVFYTWMKCRLQTLMILFISLLSQTSQLAASIIPTFTTPLEFCTIYKILHKLFLLIISSLTGPQKYFSHFFLSLTWAWNRVGWRFSVQYDSVHPSSSHLAGSQAHKSIPAILVLQHFLKKVLWTTKTILFLWFY